MDIGRVVEEELQAVVEEHRVGGEEHQVAVEEHQVAVEELQVAVEELQVAVEEHPAAVEEHQVAEACKIKIKPRLKHIQAFIYIFQETFINNKMIILIKLKKSNFPLNKNNTH